MVRTPSLRLINSHISLAPTLTLSLQPSKLSFANPLRPNIPTTGEQPPHSPFHTPNRPQLPRRGILLCRLIQEIPRRRLPNLDCRPSRRHRQLHPPLPHVLRKHSLCSQRGTSHWRHKRPFHEPILLGMSRTRFVVQREAPVTPCSESRSPAAQGRAEWVYVWLRMGQGS